MAEQPAYRNREERAGDPSSSRAHPNNLRALRRPHLAKLPAHAKSAPWGTRCTAQVLGGHSSKPVHPQISGDTHPRTVSGRGSPRRTQGLPKCNKTKTQSNSKNENSAHRAFFGGVGGAFTQGDHGWVSTGLPWVGEHRATMGG